MSLAYPLPLPEKGFRRSGIRAFCAWRSPRGRFGPGNPDLAFRPGEAPFRFESPSWVVRVGLSGVARWGCDASGRVTVVVHGELYDETHGVPDVLAERFLAEGDRFAAGLNGNFALLVVDSAADRLLVVTDRMSSRRLYASRTHAGYWLTSDLSEQPSHRFSLDPVGVAWALSSGAVFHRRTLFQGVEVLEPASVHEMGEERITSAPYWSLRLEEPEGPVDEGELEEELWRLMVGSVRRRVEDASDVYLSLSGGHDSTGIAGVLGGVLGVEDVQAFSYAGDPSALEGTDAGAAARTAEILGFDHHVLRSYDGDFIQHLWRNALLGEGMTNACDEVDAWRALDGLVRLGRRPVILTGDEYLGIPDVELASMAEVRPRLRFLRLRFPHGLADLFPDWLLEDMRDGMDRDYDVMLAGQPPGAPVDHFYYTAMAQRSVHVYLPWRERFAGAAASVRSPWTDPELADFVAGLPRRLRVGRHLYERMVERRFPDLFREPAPAAMGYAPDLRQAMRESERRLTAWLSSTSSRLDHIVPPEFGARILAAELGRWEPLRARARRSRTRARRRLSSLPGSPVTPPAPPPLDGPALFRRWAVLRMALGAAPA